MANTDEIKIAILCKGYTFETWEAEAIRQALALPFVKPVLLVREISDPPPQQGFFQKLKTYPWKNFFWRFYKRFLLQTPAIKLVDLQQALKQIPLIDCKTELKGKFSQHFSASDLARIREAAPDVILRFGFNILRGEILTVAKYGVWSFHHADPQVIRGGPGAFWEIYRGQKATGAILQRLTEKLDAGIVLRKGHFRTINRSYRANLEQLLNGTTSWIKQALIDIHNGISPAENGEAISTQAPVFTFPRNYQMTRAAISIVANKFSFHWKSLFRPEKWNVGVLKQTPHDVIENGMGSALTFLPEPPPGEYFADPFGIKQGNTLRIFFEHYFYKNQQGIIGTSDQGKFLSLDEHLSYPFIIREKENTYIVPECFQSGKIAAYSVDDPKKYTVLIPGLAAVDATPVYFENKCWLFCTVAGEFSNTNLYLFHSDSLFGKWTAHTNNPVKCDIRSARPAGTPFVWNGKLYRPAQDCSKTYGAAVVIHEVVSLNEKEFAEKEVRRLEPGRAWRFNKGLHTFSVVDENTILIDAKRYQFNFDNFSHMLGRKIKRIFGKRLLGIQILNLLWWIFVAGEALSAGHTEAKYGQGKQRSMTQKDAVRNSKDESLTASE